MNDFLRKRQEAYSKLTCPICGCTPTLTPYSEQSCGHPELERLIEETEDRLLMEEQESEPRLIKPFTKGGKVTLKVTTSSSTNSNRTK